MTVLEQEQEFERVVATTIVEEPPEVTTIPGDLDPRVVRGVEWLDENIPDWASKVDLGSFNIRRSSRCVLGQIEGGYGEAISKYELRRGEDQDGFRRYACSLGFESPDRIEGPDWQALQNSWVRAIEFRQRHA